MTIHYNGHPVVGFGEDAIVTPAAPPTTSPWSMVLASSVVSAAAGWAIEGIARAATGRRR